MIESTGPRIPDGRPGAGGSLIGDIKPQGYVNFSGPRTDSPKLPFWKQPGFKRGCGAVLGTVASVFFTVGQQSGNVKYFFVGAAISGVGTLLGIKGIADAAKRSDPSVNGDEGLWYRIQQIADKKKGSTNG